jgi:prevent-host-death family protein
MKLSRAVKLISYLKKHTADAVKEVNENSSSILITQNGEAKAVNVFERMRGELLITCS